MAVPEIKSLEDFVQALDRNVGKKDKINLILKNDIFLKEYLISLGMPEEWANRLAVYEIVKSRLSKILVKERPVRVRPNEVLFGNGLRVGITEDGEKFVIGDDAFVKASKKYEGHLEYHYIRGAHSLEKRIINENGVVDKQIHRYGGKVFDEDSDEVFQTVEWTRLPNNTQIMYHSIYQNPYSEENRYKTSTRMEYDYGYPLSLDKNGLTHTKTPIYFMDKYPAFKEWFEARYKNNEDVYVEKVFDMQEKNMGNILEDHRRILQASIDSYARARGQLTNINNGLLEIFEDSRLGSIARVFIRRRVKAVLEAEPYYTGLTLTKEERKIVLEKLMAKLDKDAEPIAHLSETHLKGVKKSITTRVRENEEYQDLRETVEDRKSLEDEDYTLEDALADIRAKSQAIEGFTDGTNAFLDEINLLDEKTRILDLQIRVLKLACRNVPVIGRRVTLETKKKNNLTISNDSDGR